VALEGLVDLLLFVIPFRPPQTLDEATNDAPVGKIHHLPR
jgi:hypothetical protein